MRIQPNDPRLARCGFAKLVGKDIDYILRKYECSLGRKSKAAQQDVVLGDVMSISRQHASISYNFETKAWELHIYGKNGVTVDGTLYTPEHSPVPLESQQLLQVADRSFYFLLPKDLSQRGGAGRRRARAPKRETQLGSVFMQQQQQQQKQPAPGALPPKPQPAAQTTAAQLAARQAQVMRGPSPTGVAAPSQAQMHAQAQALQQQAALLAQAQRAQQQAAAAAAAPQQPGAQQAQVLQQLLQQGLLQQAAAAAQAQQLPPGMPMNPQMAQAMMAQAAQALGRSMPQPQQVHPMLMPQQLAMAQAAAQQAQQAQRAGSPATMAPGAPGAGPGTNAAALAQLLQMQQQMGGQINPGLLHMLAGLQQAQHAQQGGQAYPGAPQHGGLPGMPPQ